MRLLACLIALGAAGIASAFDKPLTAWPSKDINTWLLGVWETRNDKNDLVGKVTVLPRTGGTYWVNAQRLKPKKESARFVGWISRVGPASFLTLECESSSGGLAPGQHAFVHYQVLDQVNVRVRVPTLESPQDAPGYVLRKEVRARWKAGTLFPKEGTNWRRVSEVYWSGNDEEQPFQPLRYPAGGGR